MVFRRARITRFIAALLAIGLSTQIAGAQVVNCMKMSASLATIGHSAMTHHGSDASHTQTPGDTGCSKTILCMNGPAMLSTKFQTAALAHVAPPIAFGPSALEARALRPDLPPPKI